MACVIQTLQCKYYLRFEGLLCQGTAVGWTTHPAKEFKTWQCITCTTSHAGVTHQILNELDTFVGSSFAHVCPAISRSLVVVRFSHLLLIYLNLWFSGQTYQ